MNRSGPGMDHDLYLFSPLPEREPLSWPRNAAVAVNFVLYFEDWELGPPPKAVTDARQRDPIAEIYPVFRMWSWREYALRVGIFRILHLFDELRVPVTVAAGSAACIRYPRLMEEFLRRSYEIAAHGSHATRMITGAMDEPEERAFIDEAIEAVAEASGVKPSGWVGQDMSESTRTPFMLDAAGLAWLMDWPNDDLPYRMTTPHRLLSIPVQTEWCPVQSIWSRRVLPWRHADIAIEAFDALRRDGPGGRYFGLQVHPWIYGKPHVFPHFERIVRHVASAPDAWLATVSQMTSHMDAAQGGFRQGGSSI